MHRQVILAGFDLGAIMTVLFTGKELRANWLSRKVKWDISNSMLKNEAF